MFNTNFTVRPVPSTDQVVVGITPSSFAILMVKTTLWSVAPIAVLAAVGTIADMRKPKNTEVHLVK